MVSITQTLENWTLPHRLWKVAAPLPKPLLESAAAVINHQLYVFGGFTLRWQATQDVYSYDPSLDQWTRRQNLPTPVTHVNSAIETSKVWFAGGFVGNHPGKTTAEVWQYDAATDQWQAGIPLPHKRAGGGLAIINRELHYFGGFAEDRDTTCVDHWYLPLDHGTQWVESAPLPTPRGHISVAVIKNKIYAIGGQVRHDTDPVDQSSVYCFNGATQSWTELAPLPSPRSHFEAATFVLDDYIVVTGGRNNQNPVLVHENLWDHHQEKLIDDFPLQLFLMLKSSPYLSDLLANILVYDTRRDIWHEVASLPTRLYGPVATMINQCLILSGGSRTRHSNVQTRTLLNESLIDLIQAQLFG